MNLLVPKPVEFDDPCNPSPCGANAQCNNGICTCVSLYQGDPYVGCRPECVINSECLPSKACINQKCVDPCSLETCGQNAICHVYAHVPMCSCPESMTGNALVSCRPMDRMLLSFICFDSILIIFYVISDSRATSLSSFALRS